MNICTCPQNGRYAKCRLSRCYTCAMKCLMRAIYIYLTFSGIDITYMIRLCNRLQKHISLDNIMTWKRLPRYLPFMRGIHLSPAGSPHKGPVMWSFDIHFDVSLKKLFSKQSSYRWRSFYLIVIPYNMITSSNGNIFRVASHLCGEFTGPRWSPRT